MASSSSGSLASSTSCGSRSTSWLCRTLARKAMPLPRPARADRTAAVRDAGLRRVSRLTRWLLAGALALTAGCSAIAAHVSAGASHQSAGQTAATDGSSQSGGSDSSSSSSSGSGSSDSGSTLQAPDWPPSASGGAGSVTSGGS
jgi:uncharacterized protein YceK